MNRIATPISAAIENRRGHISFHTPAHSGGITDISTEYLQYDITELSYSDNLLNADGVIAESLKNVAEIYGAERALYVTQGGTGGLHTAIRTLKNKVFLIVGETHKAVFNALRINGAKAYYTENDSELQTALKKTGAGVVIITSPNYFGRISNLETVANTVKKANALLLVDSAHGAHFPFSDLLPEAHTKFADIVVCSAHKTLAAPTGSALLFFKNAIAETILNAFSEIHSTSPSYLMMSAMEKEIAYLSEKGNEIYSALKIKVLEFINSVKAPFKAYYNDDFTRVIIKSPYAVEFVCKKLEESGIFAEMSALNEVVFIITRFNADNLKMLSSILNEIKGGNEDLYHALPESPKRQEPIEIFFGEDYEKIDIQNAVGRKSYREVGLYPPGTPLIVSGEVITDKVAEVLLKYKKHTFGLDKNSILVLK